MLEPSPLAFAAVVCRARRPFTVETVLENSGHLVLVVSSGWAQQRPSLVAQLVKNPPAKVEDARDSSLILGSERCPGEGHDHQLQCSCLGNPTDRGAWWATVHGVTKSERWVSAHTCTGSTEGTGGHVWTCHRGRVGRKRRATGLTHLSWNPAILLSLTHGYHHTTSLTFSWDPFELPENAFALPPHWSLIKCPNFTFMTFILIFFNWRIITYNVVSVSAIQQYELAISIHIYPLPHAPLSPSHPTPLVVTDHQVELLVLCSSFPLAICFTYGSVYVPMLLAQCVPPSPSLAVSTWMFSLSVSLVLPLHGF